MTATTHHRGDPLVHGVVGADRDLDEVLRRLTGDGSVVVVGPLGSGKSHFSRAVVAGLRGRGVDPVVVRAAAPLSTTPLGALSATGDARLDALRADPSSSRTEPLVIVVDDAHALDPASLELIAFALYTGRARALLSVTIDPAVGAAATPDAITDLWLEGGATRYDLRELDARTADALLTEFLGAEVLDSVTRQVLFARSGGSRMLLHELAIDAAGEAAAGRDPLDPTHEIQPGSRLSDAIATNLGAFSPEQLLALAVLGRIRGVEYATACRYIDPRVLAPLLLRRAVHSDDSPARPLHANRVLAREAERRLAPGRLDDALDSLVARALATPGTPTGGPIDRLIASAWHSVRPGVPRLDDIEVEERCRILGSAARHANADGSPDIALAYATLGIEHGGCPALRLEASRASAGLRRFGDAYAVLPVYPTDLSSADLRRLVRWWGTLITWMPEGHVLDEISEWLAEAEISDPSILCELDVLRAEAASLAMDWRLAIEIADGVLAIDAAHTLAKVRCAIISAFSTAQLRGWGEARPLFAEASRVNRDPVTGRPVSVIAELSVLCFEAMGAIIWGLAVPGHAERLRHAVELAAERDDRGGLAMAGIVSGLVLGLAAQDEQRADLEFGAALQRFDRIEFAVWRPLIAYLGVSALARLGRGAQARSVIAQIDEHLMEHHRIYPYTRFNAEAELSAADGDLKGAQRAVRAAIGLSALGTAGLHDRDLCQLARFSDADFDELRARRMQRAPGRDGSWRAEAAAGRADAAGRAGGIVGPGGAKGAGLGASLGPGDTVRLPPPRTGAQRMSQPTPAGSDAGASVGLGAGIRSLSAPSWQQSGGYGEVGAPPPNLSELTDREHEIALLVARQLSNKEIAQRLFLSVRTVESHVYTARGKLGARSRRELGRLVAGNEGSGAGQAGRER